MYVLLCAVYRCKVSQSNRKRGIAKRHTEPIWLQAAKVSEIYRAFGI